MQNENYSADNKGKRYDSGKPQYHLIPADGLTEIGKVYTMGAAKYESYNWERGMEYSRVFNSLLRHLYAFWDGQTLDRESGLHHMAHVAWNAIALLVYSLRGVGIDDRKASYLSAQQNREARKLPTIAELTDLLAKGDAEMLPSGEISLKGTVPQREELPPVVTNPYALAKRKDLPAQCPSATVVKPTSNMRCYNCPNDALPHHSVCGDCLQSGQQK